MNSPLQSPIVAVDAIATCNARNLPKVIARGAVQSGAMASAAAPSGARTGSNTAKAPSNIDPERDFGNRMRQAIAHVRGEISQTLRGHDARDGQATGHRVIDLDGTTHENGHDVLIRSRKRIDAAASQPALWRIVISHRSNATENPLRADLAVGMGAKQSGSRSQSRSTAWPWTTVCSMATPESMPRPTRQSRIDPYA
jgi:enolase